jgi:hypothetical protein
VPQQPAKTMKTCFPSPALEKSFLTSEERTRISNAERVERDAGSRRREMHHETRGISEWHEQTLISLLRHKTDSSARLQLVELLSTLTAGYGLGWSDIARLVGVSVPAVRKWRYGGDISPVRRQNLARIVAFLDILYAEGISDPAAWLNMPIVDPVNENLTERFTTKKEIYEAGGIVQLLAYAKHHISHDDLLARTGLSANKEALGSQLVRAPDGHLSIVPDKNPFGVSG